MGRYSIAVPIKDVPAANFLPMLEIYTTAADRPRLMEMGSSSQTTGFKWCGLGIPAAAGIGPQIVFVPQPEDPSDRVCTIRVATAWDTPPTIPAKYYRRSADGSAVGTGHRWRFPKGLVIPPGSSLVLWLLAGIAAEYVDMVFDL